MGEGKQIYGCWGVSNYTYKCNKCGSRLIICPREGHSNSKF